PPRLSLSFYHPPAPPLLSTLSLHDALPLSPAAAARRAVAVRLPGGLGCARHPQPFAGHLALRRRDRAPAAPGRHLSAAPVGRARSEEHTSELQSRSDLVCRLLLEKKKKI